MSQDPDFDRLLKLLALKRHERPPPGYFDRLSRDIMARVRAQQKRRKSLGEELADEASWLRRVWSAFEAKPVLAGVFGAMICGLVIFGIISSEHPASDPVAAAPAAIESGSAVFAPPTALASQSTPAAESSTNPVINSQFPASLFDGMGLQAQPADFKLRPGGN